MAAADHAEPRKLIEFAAKAAETFVSAYYSASDSPHRVQVSHDCDGGKLQMGVGQSADSDPALPAASSSQRYTYPSRQSCGMAIQSAAPATWPLC